MKVGVVYATRTQHSKRLAEAIGRELGVEARNVRERPQPEGADLRFIVGGIYAGKCHPDILTYAGRLKPDHGGKVVLVTSSLSIHKRTQTELRGILEKKNIEIVDEIGCCGGFLIFKFSHPDQRDIQDVTRTAKGIFEKMDSGRSRTVDL